MKITVDADRIHAIAGEIRSTVDTLRCNMDAIERLVYSLNGEWQGNAERAFAAKIVYVRQEFKEVEHFFSEYANLLEQSAEDYIHCDDDIAAKVRVV